MESFDHKAHLQQRALIYSMSHAEVKTTQAFDAAWKPVDWFNCVYLGLPLYCMMQLERLHAHHSLM